MAKVIIDDGLYFRLYNQRKPETYKLRFFENDITDDSSSEIFPLGFLDELRDLLIRTGCTCDNKGPHGATRWLLGSETELRLLERWAQEYTYKLDPDDGHTICSVRLEYVYNP